MNSQVKWGVVAGVVAVIAGLVWAGAQRYWPSDESGETGPVDVSDQEEAARTGDETSRTADGAAREPRDEEAAKSARSDPEAGPDAELQAEAESYVSALAEPSVDAVPMEQAETFVGPDRPLATGEEDAGEVGAVSDHKARDMTGEEAQDVGRQSAPAGMAPEVLPEALVEPEAGNPSPDAADPVTQQAASAEDTGAVSSDGDTPEETGQVTEETPQRSRIDLPLTEESPVTIADLLGPEEDIPPDAVYYVHTVQPGNDQGIWGIVQHGILENFAQGVAVHRGDETRTYQVDIPRNADEKEADESSSFLGKLIFEKSQQSYVYNFKTDRLGRNPDLIIPGQEIVIVSFNPEELIAIYKHFAREQG